MDILKSKLIIVISILVIIIGIILLRIFTVVPALEHEARQFFNGNNESVEEFSNWDEMQNKSEEVFISTCSGLIPDTLVVNRVIRANSNEFLISYYFNTKITTIAQAIEPTAKSTMSLSASTDLEVIKESMDRNCNLSDPNETYLENDIDTLEIKSNTTPEDFNQQSISNQEATVKSFIQLTEILSEEEFQSNFGISRVDAKRELDLLANMYANNQELPQSNLDWFYDTFGERLE